MGRVHVRRVTAPPLGTRGRQSQLSASGGTVVAVFRRQSWRLGFRFRFQRDAWSESRLPGPVARAHGGTKARETSTAWVEASVTVSHPFLGRGLKSAL